MNKQQLEMTFEGANQSSPPARRQRRQSRAQWWFAQMRRVVNQAFDWKPVPAARPEQGYFGLAHSR
jgi:hypothetical protein